MLCMDVSMKEGGLNFVYPLREIYVVLDRKFRIVEGFLNNQDFYSGKEGILLLNSTVSIGMYRIDKLGFTLQVCTIQDQSLQIGLYMKILWWSYKPSIEDHGSGFVS